MSRATADRYFQVNAKVDIGFVVKATDDADARREARKRLKALFDVGIGNYGMNFEAQQIRELRPVR